MKQKIVIKVELDCDKCRSKALKTAAETKGVSSVSLEGDDRDRLVVTGEVDAVGLARELKKKLRSVKLVSVEEVKKKRQDEEKKKEACCCYVGSQPPPCPPYYVVCEEYPSNCFIM